MCRVQGTEASLAFHTVLKFLEFKSSRTARCIDSCYKCSKCKKLRLDSGELTPWKTFILSRMIYNIPQAPLQHSAGLDQETLEKSSLTLAPVTNKQTRCNMLASLDQGFLACRKTQTPFFSLCVSPGLSWLSMDARECSSWQESWMVHI